jgi:hypothetical protein
MAKITVESFYNHLIQSNMSTTSVEATVDVAPANTIGYMVLDRGTSSQEIVKHTTLVGLVLGGMLRGLSLTALTDTEVVGNKKSHLATTGTIEQTNVHYLINDKVSNSSEETIVGLKTFTLAPKSSAAATATTELMRYDETVRTTGDQTVAGLKTFSTIPELPASDPTTDNQATRKAYVDARPATILSFTTYYAGENITAKNAVSIESLDNTDGGSDANFGRDAVSQGVKQAQSFIAGNVPTAFSMTVSLKKVNAPSDNVYIEIWTDNAGEPSGVMVTNGSSNNVAAGSIGAAYGDIAFTWGGVPVLAAGTRYWFVLMRTGANSDIDYYQVQYASNNAFRSGAAKKFTTVWTTNTGANDDLCFAITGLNNVAVKAIATSYNNSRGRLCFAGLAVATASAGSQAQIQTNGVISYLGGTFTKGTKYYVHPSSAGSLSATQSDPIVAVALDSWSGGFATGSMLIGRDYVNTEAETFFGATDITGAEAETLSNGPTSNADALHTHALEPGVGYRMFMLPVGYGNTGATMNWSESDIGGGSKSNVVYGVYLATGGAGAGDREMVYRTLHHNLGSTTSGMRFSDVATGKKLIYENSIEIEDPTDDVEVRFGFAGNLTEGYGENNAVSEAKFRFVYSTGGALTSSYITNDAADAPVAATFTYSNPKNAHYLRIEWTPGTSIVFKVDNVVVATVTTDIPLNTDNSIVNFFVCIETQEAQTKNLIIGNEPYIAIQK